MGALAVLLLAMALGAMALGRRLGAGRIVAASRRTPLAVPLAGALGGFLIGAALFFVALQCWSGGPMPVELASLHWGWWLGASLLPAGILAGILAETISHHRRGGRADLWWVPLCIVAFTGLLAAIPGRAYPPGWSAVIVLALLSALLVYALLPSWRIATRRNPQRAMLLRATGDIVVSLPPLPDAPPTTSGRRIVIFCDGTSNSPNQETDGKPSPTNVWRMFNALEKNERQTGRYDSGVGAGFSTEARRASRLGRFVAMLPLPGASVIGGLLQRLRMGFEAATGAGITENITRAYAEIVRQYSPGDRIYLIGFSRGAYTARCVAGVIRRCGLLKSENAWLAPELVQLYRSYRPVGGGIAIDPALLHQDAPVEFMGLFDTVGSLGVPLWGWWFNWQFFFRNSQMNGTPAPVCRHIYHAMAADERRAQFFPTAFDRPTAAARSWTETLEQVWFAGAHGDVGGGYPETGLSDIALGWMLSKAEKHGLSFDPALGAALRPDPATRRHDELERRPFWRAMGSWPRWMRLDDTPGGDRLHRSVHERAQMLSGELGRPYLQRVGAATQRFDAVARMEWCSTGLVLEAGKTYRLRHVGGSWRDASGLPCGPEGRPVAGSDAARRLFAPFRRMPGVPYMTLCAALAVPQRWPLREGGLDELADYAFRREPLELRDQVAAIGCAMAGGQAVALRNAVADGLLFVFANDLWLTARNNSGALALAIEEVPAAAGLPLWTLREERADPARWPDGTRFPRWIRE